MSENILKIFSRNLWHAFGMQSKPQSRYNRYVQSIIEPIHQVLDQYPFIHLCILFGSKVTGKFSSHSDIDLAVAAAQPLSGEMRLELIEAFSSTLQREVDLIDLLADRGPIIRQAMSNGKVIRNNDKSLYARLISRMLLDQADLMPYYDRILRERRKRFLNEQGNYQLED